MHVAFISFLKKTCENRYNMDITKKVQFDFAH